MNWITFCDKEPLSRLILETTYIQLISLCRYVFFGRARDTGSKCNPICAINLPTQIGCFMHKPELVIPYCKKLLRAYYLPTARRKIMKIGSEGRYHEL